MGFPIEADEENSDWTKNPETRRSEKEIHDSLAIRFVYRENRESMPIQECTVDEKPGVRWGDSGTCFTYDPSDPAGKGSARIRAEAEGWALYESRREENSTS